MPAGAEQVEDMEKKFLAFDFGASSGRAILGRLENGKLTMEEIHRFSNDPVEICGHYHWDIFRLFFEIKQGLIKYANMGYGKLDGIGIDTWGVDFGLLGKDGELLGAARPTAVNLRWAVGEMLDTAKTHLKDDRAELLEALYRKAVDIHEDDIAKCTAISEYGLSLLKDGDGVLTHCNAGPLATSRYGTGQGPFLLAAERGIHIRVFADETRPLLQGARLTSYELQRAGVDVTLICDNMASMVMKNGWVQACFVGCDRIAANGDFANKIGTSGVAILAKHYGIPVYTLGPTSTIDMNCPDGAHIPIELRDGDEIKNLWYEKPMALPEVKCFNPSFDVTDHELLTGIVTEKGICYPPFTESLAALFKDKE